jgi:hypothetical protein
MSYFTNFPQIDYFFGNKVKPTRFTDLHVYIDLIDQIKDDVSVYTYYNLQDGDRPDQISQKLYGTTDYHWTLYLLNDDVRLHGWPLSYNDMKEKAEEDYPNTVLLTRNNLDNKFKVGTKVRGLTSGVEGTILKRRLDFGQIVIQGTKSFTAGEIISATENDSVVTATIDAVVTEYNAIHHYEDDSARYVDVEPTAPYIQESEGKFVLFDSDYKLDTIYSSSALANADNIIASNNVSDLELYSYYKDYNVIDNSNPLTWNSFGSSIIYADGNSGNNTELGIPAYTMTSDSGAGQINGTPTSYLYTITNFGSLGVERAFGIWIKRRTGTGQIALVRSGADLSTFDFTDLIDVTSQVTFEWNFIRLSAEANNTQANGLHGIFLYDENDQVDIAGPLVYLTPNEYSKFEIREVDVYRLIDRNLDVIETAPLGVVYLNDSSNYETYFNNTLSTTYSDSADANTHVENLFDNYIVANYNDIEPALLTPVTYFERVRKENESKLQIKVIKPDIIEDVINSFNNVVLETEENPDPIVITNGQKGLGTFKTTLRT